MHWIENITSTTTPSKTEVQRTRQNEEHSPAKTLTPFNLPMKAVITIFSFLSFTEISDLRIISSSFQMAAASHLYLGFENIKAEIVQTYTFSLDNSVPILPLGSSRSSTITLES